LGLFDYEHWNEDGSEDKKEDDEVRENMAGPSVKP